MSLLVSVLISTHNPEQRLFERTLAAISRQALDTKKWDITIVDNASNPALSMPPIAANMRNCMLIREERLGLSYGRLTGIQQSKGDLIVFVDDDNVLPPNYLKNAVDIFQRKEQLGVAGGIIEPEWCDREPESWAAEFICLLALRNFGDDELISTNILHPDSVPAFIPIGAGMVMRRTAVTNWLAEVEHNTITDRRGNELTSGGDSDMVLSARRAGWAVGYFPQLKLTHLIPARRLSLEYMSRLTYASGKSEIVLLHKHGFYPWPASMPWTVPLRKARSYLRCRAWAGPTEYLRWKNACGRFDGRAAIGQQDRSRN
jgi:GT2 family glycosyltransferase